MNNSIANLNAENKIVEKKDIRSLLPEELSEVIKSYGEKSFRADQIFSWLHNKKASSFEEMTNIPKKLTELLKEDYQINEVEPIEVLVSKIDGTRKYIQRLHDGNVIESVLLKYDYGNTVCISSQVGCRMGCRFCASTIDGLERNLTAGEMVGQIYAVEKNIGERVNHVVIMGSGEPLDNYDNFLKFFYLITNEKGANLSGRNITASTCGIVPKIIELAELRLPITLALSLHAVTDEKRKEIMPVAKSFSLEKVIDACRLYYDTTGRRITLEYSLIAGKNDQMEDAKGLISIAKKLKSHVNLIPVNPIEERDYTATNRKAVISFKARLESAGVTATVRREMGRDINGACGQLRRSYISKSI